MVGLITVTGCSRAADLGARARQIHLPHLAIVKQNCEHMASGLAGDFFSDRDSMIATYIEVKDVDVLITKLGDSGFTNILVLYDENFGDHGMWLLQRRSERSNLTFSYIPLNPDWELVKRNIENIFHRAAEKNHMYTGFAVLVFSNYTLAERLEADLISQNIMDPNIILLVFYNGWDQSLSNWSYTHGISYPYEKLTYAVVRRFPQRVRHRMSRVCSWQGGKYHEVWVTILISLPIMSVVLWLIARSSPEHAQLTPGTRQAGLVKFFNCLWYLYGALLQQGGVHLPAANSARIILGTWWLYVLVVMAYYSSNLIAFLTVPEVRWIVRSFKEAVDREDLQIYIPYGTGLHQEIQVTSVDAQRDQCVIVTPEYVTVCTFNRTEYQHPCIRDYNMHAQGNSRPIGVRELEEVFLLLLIGTAISLLAAPVELFVGFRNRPDKVQEVF
ncbi:unnamed protein product [Ixodes hexagonus]